MKKILCILVMVSVFLFTGCSFNTVDGTADNQNDITKSKEAVNKNRTDNAAPATGSNFNNNGNAANNAGTPMPEKGVLSSESTGSSTQSSSGKAVILSLDNKEKYNQQGNIIFLYYQDAGGTIIPLTRRIENQNSIARAAINSIIDSTIIREEIEHYGLYPVLPQGTRILGINVVDGLATIDFNSKITSYKTETEERNIISSVVYTLTQFNSIKNVRIWIEGKPQKKLKFNTDISGTLSRNNLLINAPKLNLNQSMAKSDIYVVKFVKDKYSYLLPLSVEYEKINIETLPYKMIELLTADYSKYKLDTELPVKTRLIDYSLKDEVLTLDFNSELRNYGGNAREEALLRQIVYTAGQIDGIKRVKILIEGKQSVLPEGTELTGEIEIPKMINDVIEE